MNDTRSNSSHTAQWEEIHGAALRSHQAGRLDEAERLYRQVLAADAGHADALHLLGVIAYQTGRGAGAVALMSRAIAIDGAQPAYHYNLGIALRDLGYPAEAVSAFGAAIRLKPDYADAHNSLGNMLRDRGRLEDAIREYRAAVRAQPGYADAHNNLGGALAGLGRLEDAIGAYRSAIRLQPSYVRAYSNLGLALQTLGRFAEAASPYGKAVRLRPDFAEARSQQIHCLQQACAWHDIGVLQQDLLRLIATDCEKFSPFLALAMDSTAEQQLAVARNWSAQYRHIRPVPGRPEPGTAKIRIGYLSTDFRNHAVAQLAVALIEHHDRQRFEIIGYSYGPDDGSAMRKRLMKAFDCFTDIRSLADAEAAALIRRDRLDILVDLTGYTSNARPGLLAHRPAAAQVNFLGYPGTMGADFIDYIIADRICIPPLDDAYFSERVVRLPDCYQPNDSRREIAEQTPSRAACGLPEQGFVFCCFNNSFKIAPAMFALWMRLLQKIPGSVLWLLETNASAKDNMRREARSAGAAPERLVFAPRQPLPDHLARHHVADLFLDTLPYNAHTTASDALWAGLPVLTCLGKTFAGRVAASLVSAVGLEEMITQSVADYEKLALALATDPGRLSGLKRKLAANRGTAALFDSERFARSIEAAYERMVALCRAGRPPETIDLS